MNTISFVRDNLLAKRSYTLFELEYKTQDANAFFLCGTKKIAIANAKLLSGPAESILSAFENQ